ncbi:MAG: VWA domain-containing protein [Bacteroidota bacterium]
MIRFAHPEYLYLLAALPLFLLAAMLAARARKRAIGRFGDPAMLARMAEGGSNAKRRVRWALLAAAWTLAAVGAANPQVGTRMEEVKQEGVDLFIALDVSLSMKAEDIRPNRLEKARLEIRNLIGRLRGDRIGLVVFAGEAYTQFPLTTDYGAAALFLDAVDVDAVPVPGTSLGAAVDRALASFDFDLPSTKVLVLITDGENTEGDAFRAAREAAQKGVLLYAIGMGSPAGAPIPVTNAAGERVDFKRDRSDKVVVTRLDEVSLRRIAETGGGLYVRGTTGQDELEEIHASINALQKREFGARRFTDYEDRFQAFLAGGILLLALEAVLGEKRSRLLALLSPIGRRETAV